MDKTPLDIETPPSWKDALKGIIFISIAVGGFYLLTKIIGLENLRERVSEAGALAPLLIILAKATTIVVVPLGGTPIYPLAGVIFGFWKGLAITLIGDALGAGIAFWLSKIFGRRILRYFMARGNAETIEKLITRMGEPKMFLKARLYFAGFPELFAYASGLTSVSFFLFLPVHVGVHAIPAGLLIAFGDALVSGNLTAIISAGLAGSMLAGLGIWRFHADLAKSA